ncbi:MAG TPA: hypothetical protein EYN06_03045 [Myxococcales bacterium]|nr:hypothetical protein [Myxococcales bacterium]
MRAASAYAELLAGAGQYKDVSWTGSGFFEDSLQIVDAWGNTPMFVSLGGGWEFMSIVDVDRIYNRKEGASTMTASWIAMQHSPVERAFYDRFGDRNSDPTVAPDSVNTLLSMIGSKGLFYGDTAGTYKRSAHAARLWARMVNEFSAELASEPSVNVVDGQVGQRLWMLAGAAPDGRKAVLVSNPNEVAVRWMVRFGESQAMANHFSGVEIFQVDGNKDGKKSLLYAGEAFKIPAGTVQLVVFTP